MYKISVPVMNDTLQRAGREKILKQLKLMNAERVFLALGEYTLDIEKRKKQFETLEENCRFFKNSGFEVGVWIWTFMLSEKNSFIHMKSPAGIVSKSQVCPTDENFIQFAAQYISDIAKTQPHMIMFDDDFRYGFLDIGFGCACDNHIGLISQRLSEKVTIEKLEKSVLSGGKNKYRDAWLFANGEALKGFARRMRRAVDSVNPAIRLGLCACMSTWDMDGVDAATLSRILSGKTKPFLRLIGAPYWAVDKSWGNRLQDVIELERMERSWCGDGIEIFGEGDAYPRPRFNCPSSYVEGFDTALRAFGQTDGILKYVFDYCSGADYETEYVKAHVRSKRLYSAIDRHFSDKTPCGVRVCETMTKFSDTEIPSETAGKTDIQDIFFSPGARLMAACSIPTVYDGEGTAKIAFGENIKYVKDLSGGIIIDAAAAEILRKKGVDTGLCAITETAAAETEYFVKYNEYVNVSGAAVVRAKLSDKVKIQSYFMCGEEKIPASYIYENSGKQRFSVFLFNGGFAPEPLFRQYTRSKQLYENIRWLSGKSVDAYCCGNPDLYIMCKKGKNSTAVGLWNFFADSVKKPVVRLGNTYKRIKFINCTGKLDKNKVVLSEIQPFGFAGFEVYLQ